MRKPADIADRVRRVLSARSLTLYQVSRRSAEMHGRSAQYFLPESFYSALRLGAKGPTIHQLITLSRASGFLLTDWLALFGFHLDDLARLQLRFRRPRTVLLDSSVYDREQWIPWFEERPRTAPASLIAPLAQILEPAQPKRARELLALRTGQFLYARVGDEDLFAYPDLVPGSIVRINPQLSVNLGEKTPRAREDRLFAVERGAQIRCGRLELLGGKRVALYPSSLPLGELEFTLGSSGRILGVVDAELRPMAPRFSASRPPRRTSRREAAAGSPGPTSQLGRLIQSSRMRAGLSFREASAMSREVASLLDDRAYYASPGTLSDLEHVSRAPRNIHKIFSLCVLYSIGFWDFLRAGGLALDSLGTEPMPDELCGRAHARPPDDDQTGPSAPSSSQDRGFLAALLDEWQQIPVFLRSALPELTGISQPSLLDFFWVGTASSPIHPRVTHANLVAVNRKVKRPAHFVPKSEPEQPLYLMLQRDGSYLCGRYTADRGKLAIEQPLPQPNAPRRIERNIDAEVIGQVTAVLRRLS